MTRYRVVCTEQSDPGSQGHGRILAVGVGENPASADSRFTVQQVRDMLDQGHTFYVRSQSTGKVSEVAKYDANGVKTIRSHADGVWDNNLDSLRLCSWR